MDQTSDVIITAAVTWAVLLLALVGVHWRTRLWECRMLERWARSDLERRLTSVERELDRIKRGHL
jgi:hypothetical protein